MSEKNQKFSEVFFLKKEEPSYFSSFEELLENLVIRGDFLKSDLLYAFALVEHFLVFTNLRGPIDFHKLYNMAALVAFKYLYEDATWFLPEFSKLTYLEEKQVSCLETRFLQGINYKVYISSKKFRFFKNQIYNQN